MLLGLDDLQPGLALLTLFITRVEVIKQSLNSATDQEELPTEADEQQW